MNQHAIGIDIGGTKIAAAIVAADGAVQHKQTVPTPRTRAAILDRLQGLCETLSQLAGQPIAAIGVGTAGQVDFTQGIITYASENLPGWTGTRVADELRQRTRLPVVVENDVNALAVAETCFGAGRGFESALHIAIGTGIGGALVFDGQLWRGAHWSAGELGHLVVDWDGNRLCGCGQTGHLEAYASGPAMARHYCRLKDIPEHGDLRQVAGLAQHGDILARQAIEAGARILGLALGGILNVIDPQLLVVGGGVAELGPIWWHPFEETLRHSALPAVRDTALRPAELGTDAVLVGAACLALSTPGESGYPTS
jgi:glucokinase